MSLSFIALPSFTQSFDVPSVLFDSLMTLLLLLISWSCSEALSVLGHRQSGGRDGFAAAFGLEVIFKG